MKYKVYTVYDERYCDDIIKYFDIPIKIQPDGEPLYLPTASGWRFKNLVSVTSYLMWQRKYEEFAHAVSLIRDKQVDNFVQAIANGLFESKYFGIYAYNVLKWVNSRAPRYKESLAEQKIIKIPDHYDRSTAHEAHIKMLQEAARRLN